MKRFKLVIPMVCIGLIISACITVSNQSTEVINYVITPPIETVTEEVTNGNKKTIVDSSLIEQQIQQLWELATVKYSYTGACNYTSQKVFNDLKVPFSTKYFIFTYDGYLKAGIDLSTAEVEVTDTEVKITIAEPYVIDNVILEDTVEVLDQSNNVVNSIRIEEIMKVLSSEKEKMRVRAIKNGVLEQAKTNAELIIKVIAAELKLNAVIIYK